MSGYERKHPTTGFWVFYCNTQQWRGDEWLAKGHEKLWYKVSKHHRDEMAPGQRGVIRFAERRGNARLGRKAIEVGVYALVEVLGPSEFRSDPDDGFYAPGIELPKAAWRVPLRIVANLIKAPILVSALPDSAAFKPIRVGRQMSSIAIEETAYRHVEALAGHEPITINADIATKSESELADIPEGLRELEERGRKDPKRQARLSYTIERGSIGQKIKREREGRCQFCEALDLPAVAFLKKDGIPYAEAHHVVPVGAMAPGSLGRANIVVLCPNHHRQAHYGNVASKDRGTYWIFTIDSRPIKILKPTLIRAAE